MAKQEPKKKVAVAMSGGVDSSTAAWLLKQQGYDVIGVMAKFWGDAAFREGGFSDSCCSIEARKKGEVLAKRIGIPFYFLDFEVPFKTHVIDTFIERYKQGLTPNPCVSCNREVKIGMLLTKVRELFGVDYLATGHYAQIRHSDGHVVARSADEKKDQTYFLARLRKKDLEHLLFPCGGYTKDEVREIARKAGIFDDVLEESHELCFFSENTPMQFLQKNLGLEEGQVVDTDGQVVGRHSGAYGYTLGQRKGLDLKIEKAVYVSEIDTKKNEIIVTYDHDDKRLRHTHVDVKDFNALSDQPLPEEVEVKLRHTPKTAAANVQKTKDGLRLTLKEPQRAIAPGQLAVLYHGDVLLGGGEIAKSS